MLSHLATSLAPARVHTRLKDSRTGPALSDAMAELMLARRTDAGCCTRDDLARAGFSEAQIGAHAATAQTAAARAAALRNLG